MSDFSRVKTAKGQKRVGRGGNKESYGNKKKKPKVKARGEAKAGTTATAKASVKGPGVKKTKSTEKIGFYTVKQLFTGPGPKPEPSAPRAPRKRRTTNDLVTARQNRSRNAKGASKGMGLGARKAAASEKKLAGGGKPRSAEWKGDTNPNNMANDVGTGASANPIKPAYAPKPASAPKTKSLSGGAKPKKYGKDSPTRSMRKKRKKEEFSFGRAIRRGFGQLG